MKHINTAIRDLLTEHIGMYHNLHGIEFTTDSDNTICLGVDYPGETFNKFISLELVFESETIAEFVRAFQLQSVSGIDQITPNRMLDLFHQGKTHIFCMVEELSFACHLVFRKQNNRLLATDEDETTHEVTVPLETAKQFIYYTQRYYHVPVNMTVVK